MYNMFPTCNGTCTCTLIQVIPVTTSHALSEQPYIMFYQRLRDHAATSNTLQISESKVFEAVSIVIK